jgi:hypothetical protein
MLAKFFSKGKWKTIDLDEFIPVIRGAPAFSKAVGPEFWVILLEKLGPNFTHPI